ncbi:MAG: DUF167 domain-containing protein [Nanoarchaeota archaeon]
MILKIRVKTSSSVSELKEMGDYYVAELKSVPENNKANLELISLIAKKYRVDHRLVRIKSGTTSNHKIVHVDI